MKPTRRQQATSLHINKLLSDDLSIAFDPKLQEQHMDKPEVKEEDRTWIQVQHNSKDALFFNQYVDSKIKKKPSSPNGTDSQRASYEKRHSLLNRTVPAKTE